jgi:hypothetical protein
MRCNTFYKATHICLLDQRFDVHRNPLADNVRNAFYK